jgi:hypothetical protein
MARPAIRIYVTAPDDVAARAIGGAVVADRLAVCANIFPVFARSIGRRLGGAGPQVGRRRLMPAEQGALPGGQAIDAIEIGEFG